jgi:hypothetical protein
MSSVKPSNRRPCSPSSLLAVVAVLSLAHARAVAADSAKEDDEKDWKVLGNAKLEKKSGTATIEVGSEGGAGQANQVRGPRHRRGVQEGDRDVRKRRSREVEIRDKVSRGEKTRAIDLEGGNRVIKKVVIAFKLDKDVDRDARIVLMGHK